VLGGSFHASFWGREVMQAAIHHTPIRHLVVAVGAAYEAFEGGHTTRGTDVDFALQQCNRSIQHLTTLSAAQTQPQSPRRPPEDIYCVLTASILFIHIANIRGHFAEAIQHTRSAIRVLESFKASDPVAFPVPLKHLRAMLLSSYGQLRCMIDTIAQGAVGDGDVLVTDLKPATLFLSVSEAHIYIESLFHNTLAFRQDTFLRPPTTPERLKEIVLWHRELCLALESSGDALDALSASMSSQQPRDEQAKSDLLILRINHIMVAVWLRIDALQPDVRESAYDHCEADLEEMLVHCEHFVASARRSPQASKEQARCSSGLGCVMPLHVVAARCRNPRLRRRAVKLLLECSRREGIWDSLVTGRVAAQTVEIEEQYMSPSALCYDLEPSVREVGRVREVKIELQGERSVLLRFVIVGQGEIQKQIQW